MNRKTEVVAVKPEQPVDLKQIAKAIAEAYRNEVKTNGNDR
mgnify:CR=1 FL=1